MLSMSHVRVRRLQPEVMDDPLLPEHLHVNAYRALKRINALTFTSRLFWPFVVRAGANRPGRAPIRLLDVATGGGDVPVRLAVRARQRGIPLEVAGCDISPRSIESATANAERHGVKAQFYSHCIIDKPLSERFDIVMCSLFLHHLTEADARTTLRHMADAADQFLLIHDLKRNLPGWLYAQFAGNFLTRSPVVRVDAPRSVEAAFTVDEARAIAAQAGLQPVKVTNHWPCRYLMQWERPERDAGGE